MDEMQERFISLLLSIAGHLNLLASTLQMNLYLGPGCTMSSNMTTDPTIQPIGPPPHTPDSLFAFSLIRAKTNEFLTAARAGFQRVVNEMMISGVAVLVIDMRLGDTHHTNQTLRFIPHPPRDASHGGSSYNGFSPSDPGNDNGDDDFSGGAGLEVVTCTAPIPVPLSASMPVSTTVTSDGGSSNDISTFSDDEMMCTSSSESEDNANSNGAIVFSFVPKGTPQWFARFSQWCQSRKSKESTWIDWLLFDLVGLILEPQCRP